MPPVSLRLRLCLARNISYFGRASCFVQLESNRVESAESCERTRGKAEESVRKLETGVEEERSVKERVGTGY